MRLYRAETGKRVLIPQLRPNDGLDTLKIAIEKATRIPLASQILMTSSGLQLKPDMMFEAITSTGKDEYTIMVYNREVLTTDISNSILSLTEQVRVEPPIRPLSPTQLQLAPAPSSSQTTTDYREWGLHFQQMFEGYVAHVLSYYRAIVAHAGVCERIMEELRVQAMAVQVALTNLDAHSRSVIDTFEKFNAFAAKEFAKQARLLQSFPRDIETLRRIRVHPALLQPDSPDRFISDFIPAEKLVLWADRCREIHESLVREGKELTMAIKEVQEGTLAIRNNSGINLDQLEDAMTEILHTVEEQSQLKQRIERDQSKVKERVTDLASPAKLGSAATNLEELSQLAHIYQSDYLLTSHGADDELRNKVGIFISAKQSQTANLISQLMHISKLQSTIASIPPSLGNLDDALRKRDADFSQLVYVQRIPIAYGALVVEIVRRREYAKLLLQKSQQLAEVMSRFRHLEQRRRDSFRSEVAKFVPVVVPGLDDAPPFCEINALNTKDRLPVLTRDSLVEFERTIQQLRAAMGSPKGMESMHVTPAESNAGVASSSMSSNESSQQDALTKLRVTLTKMTNQMDVMGGEFDRLLEKSFYTERLQRLEEENAKLRADTSRTDVQQRAVTPQLTQQPFSRIQTTTPTTGTMGGGGGAAAVGSAMTSGTTAAPTSPKLSRQQSKGGNLSSIRSDMEEASIAAMNQAQQRLMKENAELQNKNKAYEARIRSLEETLYQNFRAKSMGTLGTSPTLSSSATSGRRSRPASVSLNPEQGMSIIEDDRLRRQLESKERDLDTKERELDDATKNLEQLKNELRDAKSSQQEAAADNDHLRQEVLELKLQVAAQPEAVEEWAMNMDAAQKRADELEQELRGMTVKYDNLLADQEKEKEIQELEVKTFKDRIEELTARLSLEKEILEGQLEQLKRTADEATERATELENELEVVNEELQNKVLQLEEELEHHATEHAEAKARIEEQDKQLESHRAVHNDILAQLREQENKTNEAKAALEKAQAEISEWQTRASQLEADKAKVDDELDQLRASQEQAAHKLEVAEAAKHDLNLEVDGLRSQLTDIQGQHENYKSSVNQRLEEAKLMVRRAEEDWKEKARLLEQMEKAIGSLEEPLKACMRALDLEEDGVQQSDMSVASVEQAHQRINEVSQAIARLVQAQTARREASSAKLNERLDEMTKEHSSARQALESTIQTLEQALEKAKEESRSVKQELEAAVIKARDELEALRQEHNNAIARSEPPKAPIGSPTTASQSSSRKESWSLTDRRIMATLSLDLGIPVPMISDISSSQVLLPSASVLLEKTTHENQHRPLAVPSVGSSSSASTTTGERSSSSRHSSTTVPLPREQLATLDFTQMDLEKLAELIKRKNSDIEHLLKRWQRECKSLKDKYNRAAAEAYDKIAFRNFKVDDLTLFLPTRNSISKPWAAFNINSPHYFLQMTPSMAAQLKHREWIVARINSITEAVVDRRLDSSLTSEDSSSTSVGIQAITPNNPFGLADGVKYYLLEATSWNGSSSHYHGHSKSSSSHHYGSSSGSSISSRLRHHASTPALSESSSSLRREKERSKKDNEENRENDSKVRSPELSADSTVIAGSSSKTEPLRSQHLKSASETSIRSASGAHPPSGLSSSSSTAAMGGSSPAVLSLLQHTPKTGMTHSPSFENLMNASSVVSVSSASSLGKSTGTRASEAAISAASASLQQTQSQILKQQQQQSSSGSHSHIASIFNRRLSGADQTSHLPSASSNQLSTGSQQHQRQGSISQTGGTVSSSSSSSSGKIPITQSETATSKSQPIPIQSPAASALRALSSSVGSTGSTGSHSSLHSHTAHIVSSSTHVTSSPPRPMILSSSPHKTSVSTVSAMGRTVGISGSGGASSVGSNSSSTSGGGGSHSSATSAVNTTTALASSPSGAVAPLSSAHAPANPSRLSMSSNRDDLEQIGVFATDEDQAAEREKQERHEKEKEQKQQQRIAQLSRSSTSSSSSTWHVPN